MFPHIEFRTCASLKISIVCFLSLFISFLEVPICNKRQRNRTRNYSDLQQTSKRADLQFCSAKFNDLNLKRQRGKLQIIFTDVFATDKRIILIIPYLPFIGNQKMVRV